MKNKLEHDSVGLERLISSLKCRDDEFNTSVTNNSHQFYAESTLFSKNSACVIYFAFSLLRFQSLVTILKHILLRECYTFHNLAKGYFRSAMLFQNNFSDYCASPQGFYNINRGYSEINSGVHCIKSRVQNSEKKSKNLKIRCALFQIYVFYFVKIIQSLMVFIGILILGERKVSGSSIIKELNLSKIIIVNS
jgi:hypothetical protein